MLCKEYCPRGLDCKPLSNLVADNNTSNFVCVGLHEDMKEDYPQDIYRHCFKSSADTDSMFDYDEYDLLSVASVITEAILIHKHLLT